MGEARNELNLLGRERPDLLAVDDNAADQLALLEHRHREDGSKASEFDIGNQQRIALHVGLFRCDIGDVDPLLCSEKAAKGRPRAGTDQSTLTVLRNPWRSVVQSIRTKRLHRTELPPSGSWLAQARR